ncbi:MAG: hypothetical protein KA338_25380 [Chloroflexi bacterium]|nr:hypothetical protein [Chloroflexota bacterium]
MPYKVPLFFNTWLYQLRMPGIVLALVFIIYSNWYLWLNIPYEDFTVAWRPDSRMVVINVPQESVASAKLQAGDILLAIDRQLIRRMSTLYPLPVKAEYEFTFVRNGQIASTTINFPSQITPLAIELRLPPTILSLMSSFLGVVILLLAKPRNEQALIAGYTFLFSAAVTTGIQSALYGVPGAWFVGYTLIFFMLPLWSHLGLIPRTSSLSSRTKILLAGEMFVATVLAGAATYEVWFLYPKGLSFGEVTGVSLYLLGFLLAALGIFSCFAVLLWRVVKANQTPYVQQQLKILLVFIALGIVPTVLLTILPHTFFDITILPFPLAITLMILVPAGFLFVIYRRGFLGLDRFFTQVVYLIIIALLILAVHSSGLLILQKRQSLIDTTFSSTVMLLPTLLFVVYANRPVHRFVDELIYGKSALSHDRVSGFALAFSAKPEVRTLTTVLESLSLMIEVPSVALYLKNEQKFFAPIAIHGVETKTSIDLQDIGYFDSPIIRAIENTPSAFAIFFSQFDWAEILVPVSLRNELVGVLVLSQPGGDGFFNARQVSFLRQFSGILAVGVENILLFESARKLSRQILVVQEDERRALSLQIHDDPLHRITYAISILDHILVKGVDKEGQALDVKLQGVVEHLRQAAESLRMLCINLYSPFRFHGVRYAIDDIVRSFHEQYGLKITVSYSFPDEIARDVPTRTVTAISRILTGALTNVVKHAECLEVFLEVFYKADSNLINVVITDQGLGTTVNDLSYTELLRQGHLGLVGMYEWAQYVNGNLRLLPNEPSGLKVVLQCPVTSPGISLEPQSFPQIMYS